MKTVTRFPITALFLIAFIVTGCDEETDKSDYILVTVNLSTVVYQGEMGGNTLAGQEVSVSIVQLDGERVDETATTDAAGLISATETFRLYPDQSIEACVELTELPGNFNCQTLAWQGASSGATETGGERTYNWEVILSLVYPL